MRHILHTEYYPAEAAHVRAAANEYVRRVADEFGIPARQLGQLHQQVDFLAPRAQSIEYRLHEVKKFFSAATYAYYQTIHNTPVWGGGLTVTVKENPLRIVHADHRGHSDLEVDLPPQALIERLRRTLSAINASARQPRTGARGREVPAPSTTLARAFPAVTGRNGAARARRDPPPWMSQARIRRGLFYVYRYEAKHRQPGYEGTVPPADHTGNGAGRASSEAIDRVPTLPLPPVASRIRNGRHYLVVELVFQVGRDPLQWKALIEPETGSILWLRPMTACVNGLVFTYDPKTSTGVLANNPDSANATLNPLRDDVTLQNLDGPVMNVQSLSGMHVALSDDDAPTFTPPTKATGVDFDYDARTNEFAAVNAYYHADNLFEVIESLGFTLSGAGAYFDGTVFPVHLDHRASGSGDPVNGIEVNAFCNGDAGGASGDGIGLVGYCLSDDTGWPTRRPTPSGGPSTSGSTGTRSAATGSSTTTSTDRTSASPTAPATRWRPCRTIRSRSCEHCPSGSSTRRSATGPSAPTAGSTGRSDPAGGGTARRTPAATTASRSSPPRCSASIRRSAATPPTSPSAGTPRGWRPTSS